MVLNHIWQYKIFPLFLLTPPPPQKPSASITPSPHKYNGPFSHKYYFVCVRDHVGIKKKIHMSDPPTPTPMKKVWSLIPHIHIHPLICMHHSWFTFIIFTFKYYLKEWYYHRNWLQTHLIHFHMGVGQPYRKVWNGLLSSSLPFATNLCDSHVTFWMVPKWLQTLCSSTCQAQGDSL